MHAGLLSVLSPVELDLLDFVQQKPDIGWHHHTRDTTCMNSVHPTGDTTRQQRNMRGANTPFIRARWAETAFPVADCKDTGSLDPRFGSTDIILNLTRPVVTTP